MPYKDPAMARAGRRNREHIRRAAVSDITPEQETKMRRKARKCPLCGVFMTGKPWLPNSKELDHILPICMGGTHTHGNVRIICRKCNLSRPKDGSDYMGTLSLWAESPVPRVRPERKICRKGLHPWVPENLEVQAGGKKRCKPCRQASAAKLGRAVTLQQCQCGAMFAAPGRTFMCPDCVDAAGHKAAELHASGLSWKQVAEQVGYTSDQGAWFAARRIGYVPPVRPEPSGPPPRRCTCGEFIPPGSRGKQSSACDHCIERTALCVFALHSAGKTHRWIADLFGYRSITTVTNLLDSIGVPRERGRYGRPVGARLPCR